MKRMLFTLMLCGIVLPGLIMAQGTTTAAFNGLITDNDGNPIVGAAISALHTPTGTVNTAVSRQDGRFNILAVRVGGPYTVTVSMDPFKTQELKGITLKLGEDRYLKFKLVLETIAEEITVIASNPVMSEARTGATQNVSQELIQSLPTISRSLSDFTRMSPQVIGSDEFDGAFNAGGRNSKYNNIQIDGAQSNDLFGLGPTGTPGGQAEAMLISLEAVQEFQVVMAPYDVRQGGFTGGGVNIITKSGRNKMFGSLFFEGRNEKLVGNGPDDKAFAKFSDGVFGGSFGGAIIKDKLFFFLNAESENKKTPQDYYIAGSSDTSSANFGHQAEADRIISILQTKYGYDAGGYDQVANKRERLNLFGRIDWNINASHRLTLRTSTIKSDSSSVLRNSKTSFQFGNNGLVYTDRTISTVMQLDSVFGKNLSNQLLLGYQHIKDSPTYLGEAFPHLVIGGNGVTFTAGAEEYRHVNILKQHIIEITDNMTLFKGKHTLILGTHNEFFNFYNAYVVGAFGKYEFKSIDDLDAEKPYRYTRNYSLTDDPNAPAKFWVYQFGLHAMDEWNVLPNLKLTLGLRADIPIIPNDPPANALVEQKFGIPTNQSASGNILWSPRLGFNYQVGENQEMQVRGGIGIFSGRAPYVWISNQFSNTGKDLGRYQINGKNAGDVPFFVTDPFAQPLNPTLMITGDVNLIDKGFRFPQVMRASIAVDKKLPFGFTGTAEFVYSKNIKEVMFQNINLPTTPVGTSAAGTGSRPLFGTPSTSSAASYGSPAYVNKDFRDVILLSNTNLGYQWNASFQIQREWGRGNMINAAYSYGVAKDVNSGTSSRAISNWGYNITTEDPNVAKLSYSSFDPGHRIMLAAAKSFDFFKNAPTTFSIFYNGRSGSRYNTRYYNDANGDGQKNDSIYVPASADEIVLTKGTWEQLDAYIKADPGLDNYRGQIAPRFSSRDKWYNGVDFKLSQQLPVFNFEGHRIELYLTVKNLLNVFNKDWGVYRYINFDDSPLTYVGTDASGKAKIEFWGNTASKDARYTIYQLLSRWQMLLGVKYQF